MWQRIYFLIYKEILAVWRDKKSRMVLILPPLAQLFVFSFAATLDVKNVTMGVLNRDHGKESFELVQRFKGAPAFTNIHYLPSVESITPYIDNQEGLMVLSIDEQFSRNLNAGKPATIQLIMDGRKSNTTQIVAGYANTIISQYNKDFAADAGAKQQQTVIVPRNWYNPNLLYYWFNVPSLSGILTLLVALIIIALSVSRERELGTFDQLLVSPLLPVEIMIGKTIPAIILAMLEGSVIILFAIIFFQIPFTGSIFLLYMNMFVFVTAVVGAGLFISALCNTQQQAILGTYMFMSPAVLLSGFATPIENMPHWLQMVTYLNPLRYYLIVAKGVFLKAMPFDIVWANTWPLAVIAVINLAGSTWFFRRRLD